MPIDTTPRPPRIAIAGIAIESSTFTPYRSRAEDFEVRRGTSDVLARYPFTPPRAEYVGILQARALPGGPVVRSVYDRWKQEIVKGLAAALDEAPLDGFFFDIHGAMSTDGLDDAEGDLITAIRATIGDDVVVGTAMDLHGNVSETLFDACDLLTCYRHAPHIDAWETRLRGLEDLVAASASVRDGAPRPYRALVHVPILLPGEMTSTRIEPARSLYGRIPELTRRTGVQDVSCWIGFAWADQPRCQAAIVAHGSDLEQVESSALELARELWEVRHDFVFVAPTGTFEECLDTAIASPARPFWISDSGDNPGAGGADDTTYCLARLVARDEIRRGDTSALMVALVDPPTVDRAHRLGVGDIFDATIGGRIDDRDPGPIQVEVEVLAVDEASGTGRSAALHVLDSGVGTGLTVVVTSRRSQWATASMYERLGLTMDGQDIVVVKMGYLEPEQYAAAAEWMLALTPGGVDQDLLRLGHHRIRRPMIPFDADIPAPITIRSGRRRSAPDPASS